jgi:hypothetical protein
MLAVISKKLKDELRLFDSTLYFTYDNGNQGLNLTKRVNKYIYFSFSFLKCGSAKEQKQSNRAGNCHGPHNMILSQYVLRWLSQFFMYR